MDLKTAYEILIEFLISDSKNKKYINDLEQMLFSLKSQKCIVQENHPKHTSILMGYNNLFLLSDNNVIIVAEYIKKEKQNV